MPSVFTCSLIEAMCRQKFIFVTPIGKISTKKVFKKTRQIAGAIPGYILAASTNVWCIVQNVQHIAKCISLIVFLIDIDNDNLSGFKGLSQKWP